MTRGAAGTASCAGRYVNADGRQLVAQTPCFPGSSIRRFDLAREPWSIHQRRLLHSRTQAHAQLREARCIVAQRGSDADELIVGFGSEILLTQLK